jgi:hypothetical protein
MQHLDLPSLRKMRLLLFLLGLFKIPMIGFVRPRLMAIDDEHVLIRIRLNRRTKNHLGSMYFGALSVGADLAGAIHSMYFTGGKGMSMSFKSMHAEFLRRAEGAVFFESNDGKVRGGYFPHGNFHKNEIRLSIDREETSMEITTFTKN